ncbi:MAG: HlyC/CorC family transporter [Anaerolineae bacterium]|nr:HlyC/CorC family transporter [Anaerolineae bacterium]
MSEAALIAARKIRLQQRADSGDEGARVALELASNPNAFLATVQIFITLLGTFLGAFSGTTLAKPLAELLNTIPVLSPYSESISLAVVVLLVTYVTLIIGELVPKAIALSAPENVAVLTARPMRVLSRIAYPVVVLLDFSSKIVMRLLGIKETSDATVTEAEVKGMIALGTQTGEFQKIEQHMVERVFRLGDLHVAALMTPRTEIVWLNVDDDQETTRSIVVKHGFARYPVAQDSLDNVLGLVRAKDLLNRALSGQPLDLRAELETPLYIPETMSAFKILDELRKAASHTALVIDEYGGLQGLVTLNDLLGELVGDALLPNDGSAEPQVIRRDDGSLLLDGMLTVDYLKEVLALRQLPGEETGDYQTLGGFVMTQLGRIPVSADHFELENFRFEVMDMDGHRVDKVLVAPIQRKIEVIQ